MNHLLVDLDGVVIKGRHRYFSEKFAEEYGVPLEKIMPFFKREFKQAAIGNVDIRDVLPLYLDTWNWKGGTDSFLDYWFAGEKEIDSRMLQFVSEKRDAGWRVFVASDNERNRANYLMETLGLKQYFDGQFFSYYVQCTKEEPRFFEQVCSTLQVPSSDIVFWDDDPKNVDVARNVGITAYVYENFEEFERQMRLVI